MTKFLPLFPLDIVVYPGQELNLHVFEPRYKQLIAECAAAGKTFGIPTLNRDTLNEFGTEVEILEVTKIYEGGEMDIKTRGVKIFRILEVLKQVPDKLYPAAVVFEVKHLPFDTAVLNPTLVDLIDKLQKLMDTDFNVFKKFKNPMSFELANYTALTPEDQYRILSASSEKARQWFLIQHLLKLIPSLEETEKLKQKIRMNGHFRKEIPPKF
jgi:Lon protease-like protein